MRYRVGIVSCVLVAFGLSTHRAVADQPALTIHAEPVAPAPEDQSPQRIVISPDGHHIAFVSTRGSRFVVVVDGKPSGKYDEIGHINNAVNKEIVFSADGQHVMYIARRGDDQMVVVDGQEMVGYQMVDQFTFSPDGKQNAFVAQHDQQNAHYLAVVKGKDSPIYATITGMQFSSNSAHVAYVATVADASKPANTTVVMDGKNETPFYQVHDFHFSADGNHWAYIGEDFTGNVQPGTSVQSSHLMADGKEVAKFEKVYTCQLSADGHVAYTANKLSHMGTPAEGMLKDQCVGLDAKVWDISKGYRFPQETSPAYFSPDGQHVAWVEQHPGNNELCVSVDGKRGLGYKNIQNVTFSLDSQHINYVAEQNANGTYVVRDDDEAGPYQRAPNGMGTPFKLYLSSNRKHLAYQAGDGKMTFVVEDGKPQPSYEAIYGPLVFSPDGEHLAYIAKAKDATANLTPIQRQQAEQSPNHSPGVYVVLDGQQQPVLPAVRFGSAINNSGPHFSADGKHLAYTDDGSKIVIDGKMVKISPTVQQGANGSDATFQFTADGKHVLFAESVRTAAGMGVRHYLIDGDEVAGYQIAANVGVQNYQPTLEPDGSVFFFATKDGDKGTVNGNGPHAVAVSSALYRVTVTPGPARDFGTTASTNNVASDNSAPTQTNGQQSTAAASNQPASNQPAQTSNTQSHNNPQSSADKAINKAQKAKDSADRVRGLFGH